MLIREFRIMKSPCSFQKPVPCGWPPHQAELPSLEPASFPREPFVHVLITCVSGRIKIAVSLFQGLLTSRASSPARCQINNRALGSSDVILWLVRGDFTSTGPFKCYLPAMFTLMTVPEVPSSLLRESYSLVRLFTWNHSTLLL